MKKTVILQEDLTVVLWEINVLSSRRVASHECTSYAEALIKAKELADLYKANLVNKFKAKKQLDYGYN